MSASSRRPRTLHEVSVRAANGEQAFDPALREFLDHFYANPEHREASMHAQPLPLDDLRDAYLGATAEHLARCYNLDLPVWCETYGLALRRPFFASGLESLKAMLTVESPTAFRRRMLFVSKNALSRPRMHADGPDRETAPGQPASV
jgi:hypothetical protein